MRDKGQRFLQSITADAELLSTKMPMFHVKHLSLFKAVCGDDYVDG